MTEIICDPKSNFEIVDIATIERIHFIWAEKLLRGFHNIEGCQFKPSLFDKYLERVLVTVDENDKEIDVSILSRVDMPLTSITPSKGLKIRDRAKSHFKFENIREIWKDVSKNFKVSESHPLDKTRLITDCMPWGREDIKALFLVAVENVTIDKLRPSIVNIGNEQKILKRHIDIKHKSLRVFVKLSDQPFLRRYVLKYIKLYSNKNPLIIDLIKDEKVPIPNRFYLKLTDKIIV